MYQALIIVHVLIAAGIIALVLLQQGRGADAGAAFGSGASGTVFGAQGSATFLTRATGVLAALFFTTSLGLAIVGDTRQSEDGFMDVPATESLPTDLPPGQSELDRKPVSDMPGLPSVDDGSALVDERVDLEGSSPDLDEIPSEVPQLDERITVESQIEMNSGAEEATSPVPAESQ